MPALALGRLIVVDERDRGFPMSALLPRTESYRSHRYWWHLGWTGNQGPHPHCVAYAWLHWAEDGPSTLAPKAPGKGPGLDPVWVYREAQKVDQWAGEDYDGTSVRAGAKILQNQGLIQSYHWAWDLPTVVQAVLERGPVVVGTYWYGEMFTPDQNGVIRARGTRVGGHAYVLNGVSTNRAQFRLKNSWGVSWGAKGQAWIPFEDMEKLLAEAGEACIAVPREEAP